MPTLSAALAALPTSDALDSVVGLEGSTAKKGDAGGSGTTYLKYVALLSQTGTDAPVATVLENTLGGAVVWTRDDVGQYRGTLADVFTEEKTIAFMSPQGGANNELIVQYALPDVVIIVTRDAGDAADNVLYITGIKIIVYP